MSQVSSGKSLQNGRQRGSTSPRQASPRAQSSGVAKVAGEQSVFAGRSDHGTNFFRLLLENRRVAVLPEIADRFEALKADLENRVDVTVTSAGPVSERQIDEISTALRERLGRDVNIEMKIDENLIGGAVIRAGDVVIDGSLRARLEGLANALTK